MTDQTPDMVTLDEADIHSLRDFAERILGLEVKPAFNCNALRSRILKAKADVTEVPVFVPQGPGKPRGETQPAMANNEPVAMEQAKVTDPALVQDPMHHRHDPRVTINISRTDDKRRSKEVSVMVNGVTFQIQRAQNVAVPYRVYEALQSAVEDAWVDGDEINPATGEPFKVKTQVPSYPFMVVGPLPSAEEVQAWRDLTAGKFQKAAA